MPLNKKEGGDPEGGKGLTYRVELFRLRIKINLNIRFLTK